MYSVSIFLCILHTTVLKLYKRLIKALTMSRRLHPPFLVDVGVGGDATDVVGAGAGSEAESGSCWCLEKGKKMGKNIFLCCSLNHIMFFLFTRKFPVHSGTRNTN